MGRGLVGTGWFIYSAIYPHGDYSDDRQRTIDDGRSAEDRGPWSEAVVFPTGAVHVCGWVFEAGERENHRGGVPAAGQMRMERPAPNGRAVLATGSTGRRGEP